MPAADMAAAAAAGLKLPAAAGPVVFSKEAAAALKLVAAVIGTPLCVLRAVPAAVRAPRPPGGGAAAWGSW